jgi:hypothetical protein
MTARGFYGYRIDGLEEADHLLQDVEDTAPRLDVRLVNATPAQRIEVQDDRVAHIPLMDGAALDLDRSARSVLLTSPVPLPPEDAVHPWLVPAVSVFASWDGRTVLHAGVVVQDGRALAVVGAREAGKSTLMGRLATTRGDAEIYADDLMVTDGRRTWPGPRCIDLRPGSLVGLAGVDTTASRSGQRHRLRLPASSTGASLAGIVFLGWADDLTAELLPATTVVRELVPQAAHSDGAPGLLPLLGLPAWRLSRPRRWDLLDQSVDRLLKIFDGLPM